MKLQIVKHGPVRVGVVGCGVVSDYGHIPSIHRSPHAKLAAFCDPDKERRETQAAKYKLPCFASVEEMVAAVPLDALSVPTHPSVKLDVIRVAAKKGLHAFCEKPLTETVPQAEELVRTMDEAGLFVGIAFVYRGKKVVQRMMELVREGAIGRLRVVRLVNLWDYHGLRDEFYATRRRRALKNLGTLDCGVHELDLARYISGGEFEKLNATGTIVEKENEYPDHILVQGKMNNGVIVSVEESAVWGHTAKERPVYEQTYTVIGEDGVLTVQMGDWNKQHTYELRIISRGKQWTEQVSSDKAWDDTYNQFFQVILGQEPAHRLIANGHDALTNMRVAAEVIRQCGGK